MFTLGSITCPSCGAPLRLLAFKASDGGHTGDATLRCPTDECLFDWSLTATLTALPLLAPSPRVAEQEPPAPVEGLDDLEHVTTDHLDRPHVCPTCGDVFHDLRGLKTHGRKHEAKTPCPNGCGGSFKASGLSKHLHTCPNRFNPPIPGGPPCPPPPPPTSDASSAERAGSSKRPAAGSALSATGPTPTSKKTTAKASAPTTPKVSTTSAAAATTSTDEPDRAPIGGRTSAVCGMVDEAGPCLRTRDATDKGWRRARTAGCWMDLCPDHRDATDDEVAALLSADSLPALT